MKTRISFKKIDGSDEVIAVDGNISSTLQAKRELAAKLDLPLIDMQSGQGEDIDARLLHGRIAPKSVEFAPISE